VTHKKPTTIRISTKLNEIRSKIGVEFKLRVLNHFLTNFFHFGGKQNKCVRWFAPFLSFWSILAGQQSKLAEKLTETGIDRISIRLKKS
jgi:hypothetical protein